ncbi:MAG: hypothetical protein RDU20_08280 [Desulfomonilaceae bacterium]|nr:hypothetical protein [Desulfomonilaceae bacterium]
MRRTGVGILCVVVACSVVGCGYKTSPRPATETVPAEIGLVAARAYPGRIVLTWDVPRTNTDGSELKDISGFRVYRNEEMIGDECVDCEHEKGTPTNIDFQHPVNAVIDEGVVTYTDESVTMGNVYSYSVTVYNLRGVESRPSEHVAVVFDEPPPPPDGLQAEPETDGVSLKWTTPRRLAGIRSYHVYRGDTGDVDAMKSIGRTKWAENYFLDKDVTQGKVYYYTVRSVKMNRGIPLESEPSEVIEGSLAPDRARPPENVSARSVRNGIRVEWDPVQIDSEEANYNLYRSKSRRMPSKLNAVPLTKPWYIDRDVTREETYRYAVTAFPKDKPDEESNRSASNAVKYGH